MVDERTCPRCSGPLIVIAEHPDWFGQSITSPEHDIDICSDCLVDEWLRFTHADEMVPQHEWPIREGAHDHLDVQDDDLRG